MKLPHDIGPVHFVGIGGIGMSGIAEVMVNLGYTVQGSDQADSANVKRLRDKGVHVAIGHTAANLSGVRVVVVSSAIKPDNPELLEARAQLHWADSLVGNKRQDTDTHSSSRRDCEYTSRDAIRRPLDRTRISRFLFRGIEPAAKHAWRSRIQRFRRSACAPRSRLNALDRPL